MGTLLAAWLDVRSKPLRTFAAIAGMVAAVVAVVLVDAAGILSRDASDTYLARQYGLPVTMNIYADGEATSRDSLLLLERLRANQIVASTDTSVPIQLVWRGSSIEGSARWLSSSYTEIQIVDVVSGVWPTTTANSDVVHAVVTEGWAEYQLGITDQQVVGEVILYSAATDSTFDIRTTPMKPIVIDAVVKADTAAFANQTGIAIISDMAHPDLLDSQREMSFPLIARSSPRDMGLLQGLVASITSPNGQQLFTTSRADQGDQLAPVLDQQRVTATAVTVVSLTIGGLGILGVGLASVRERSKDFGLRRALGASTFRIFMSVIAQSLLEVAMAAAIGIPLSAFLLEHFARHLVLDTLPLPSYTSLPLSSAFVGLIGALTVGLIAGLLPAISAARASVVQALRG